MSKLKNTLNAVSIGEVTLLGVETPTMDEPLSHGNCFGVSTDLDQYFKIVNFNYENFKFVLAHGVSWPVKIRPLSERVAVIHDERIPREWYDRRYCEVCCPENLQPEPQRLQHERDIACGAREDRNGFTCIKPSKHPELKP